jgi:hypothetical protein
VNTPNLVNAIRNTIAADSSIRALLRCSSKNNALRVIVYSDSEYVGKEDFFSLPGIAVRIDEDASTLRGSDSNTVFVEIAVVDSVNSKVGGAVLNCTQIKDLLKILFRDNHNIINAQALSLGFSLKVRDSEWVSSITYKDKTQGTERLHKIISTVKLIVGD